MGVLASLFAPERVAVVGASDEDGSVGLAVTHNLLADFHGDVFAVNPQEDAVLGLQCVDEIDEVVPIDVAVIAVPAAIAVQEIREAAEAGVQNVVVITAGFRESGDEGAKREAELVDVADAYDLNLVGPNSVGVLSPGVGFNASFAPTGADPGHLSFMSQSGAFVTAVLDWAADRRLGFKDVVSLGNKAVLDERDFAREWADDPETRVILGYLEDVSDGRGFIETARDVTQETPMIVVKSGRTEAGAAAAASHTGAIAGSDAAYSAAFRQSGVIRVETVQELFDAASILGAQPLPDGDAVGVVTNAGGPGVMTTDAIGDSPLTLATLADETTDRLDEILPAQANRFNPVDIIGDADVDRFEAVIDAVLGDPNVDMGIVLACPTATLSFAELAERTVALQDAHDLPVAATFMGGQSTREATGILAEADIPAYFDPARAIWSLATLAEYRTIRARTAVEPTSFDVDETVVADTLADAADEDRSQLGVEAMDILDAYGIPTPAGAVVTDPDSAVAVADDLDGDVVMKIASPDIVHKSDAGGVAVGVTPGEVRETYERLHDRARDHDPDATILGVQIQEQLDTDAGVETIVGMTRDPTFGPVVLFGLGGIYVEILEDTTVRVAPVSEPDARQMTEEIRAAPLLHGARGREPVDVDALVEVIQRLSQLVVDYPAITELDINPVLATPEGATAVDLRITLDREARCGGGSGN